MKKQDAPEFGVFLNQELLINVSVHYTELMEVLFVLTNMPIYF